MDAVEFLKKLKRMCDKNRDSCHGSCYVCEIFVKKVEKSISCSSFIKEYPEEAVSIVEKWSAEHPAKTRQSEFLNVFPDAEILENRAIQICPKLIEKSKEFNCRMSCDDCQEKYWLAEVE